MGELTGRVALVTGAASGIGEAIARALSGVGATVCLADKDAERAVRVASDLEGATAHETDISDVERCRELVSEVLGANGRLDILVNNAGLQRVFPIEAFPDDAWDAILSTVLTGAFALTRAALPGMYERGWGRIVNVGSIHAFVASPNKAAYVAAKHGLLGLTGVVALEAAPHGVTANLICPAYVRTPLVTGQIAAQAQTLGISEDDVLEQVMLTPSAIRRLIEPAEVAAYAVFLCSEAASMITGAAQVIDGGWTAR